MHLNKSGWTWTITLSSSLHICQIPLGLALLNSALPASVEPIAIDWSEMRMCSVARQPWPCPYNFQTSTAYRQIRYTKYFYVTWIVNKNLELISWCVVEATSPSAFNIWFNEFCFETYGIYKHLHFAIIARFEVFLHILGFKLNAIADYTDTRICSLLLIAL